VSAAGGRRYLRVVIDPKYPGCELAGLLGHELQHVLEIVSEPTVVDTTFLVAFYRRIGLDKSGGLVRRFETRQAIEAGTLVMREAPEPPLVARRLHG
jgi:hypothetical protein